MDPERREALLAAICELAAAPISACAADLAARLAVSPPAGAAETEVLLRTLLPGVEPRERDGAWSITPEVASDLLWPRYSEMEQRAAVRGSSMGLAGPDEGVWLFEEIRALADRVEDRSSRLVRAIDVATLSFEEQASQTDGAAAMCALERAERADTLLRSALYKAHTGGRALSRVRRSLGVAIQSLLSSPPAALDLVSLHESGRALAGFDAEIDRLETALTELGR